LAAAAATSAAAHGPQIQITADGGKLVTHELLLEGPYSDQLSSPASVYVMPVMENLGVWYTRPNTAINPALQLPKYYSGPGLAYGFGYNSASPAAGIEAGSVLRLSFNAGFKRWTGSEFGDAGSVELEAFRGSPAAPTASARTSDAAPLGAIDFEPVDYSREGAESHQTLRFRLLGDGVSPLAASPDGVYLASLNLSTSQPNMGDSEPFAFVLNKRGGAAAVQAAIASLGVDPDRIQQVPEPGGLPLAAVLFGAAPFARRRGGALACTT
jgi:hypothetical protein